MNTRFLPAALLLLTSLLATVRAPAAQPLKALLILGGCCHDYAHQKDILKEGIQARANVSVDILYSEDRSTKARFEIYEKPDWARGYDVVIHDECSADVKDLPYVQNILQAHRNGVAAVNLHCAMHCYRTGTEDWFAFVGLQSTGHGPQAPIEVQYTNPTHPVTKGLADWTTINEELYNNKKIFPDATPLSIGKQTVRDRESTAVVTWVHDYGKSRVFSTTLGHNSKTVADDRYLDLVTRGLLWACRKLDDEGQPSPGYGKP